MGRNPTTSSSFDLKLERMCNDSYDEGWEDCKKAIMTLIVKLPDHNDLLDKEDVIRIVEKI